MIRFRRFVGVAIVAGSAVASADAYAQGEITSQRYAIEHPDYGEVGTFTNIIRRQGDVVVVNSQTDITVKFAAIPVYRQEGKRQEIWCNGRLVQYDSYTNDDGEDIQVKGRSAGPMFVVNGTKFDYQAPSEDVFPTNGWTTKILGAKAVMAPTDGELYEVSVAPPEQKLLELSDRKVMARYYEISGDLDLGLWYDQDDTLVKFTYPSRHDIITFTLQEQKTEPGNGTFAVAACPGEAVPPAGGVAGPGLPHPGKDQAASAPNQATE